MYGFEGQEDALNSDKSETTIKATPILFVCVPEDDWQFENVGVGVSLVGYVVAVEMVWVLTCGHGLGTTIEYWFFF